MSRITNLLIESRLPSGGQFPILVPFPYLVTSMPDPHDRDPIILISKSFSIPCDYQEIANSQEGSSS
jgi:hypothetical protein